MDKKRLDAVRRLVARLVAVPDLTGEALDIAPRLNRHLALPRPMSEILALVPGETQAAKIEAIGISTQGFYNWLNGGQRPRTPHARRIAKLTGLPVDVIRGVETPHIPSHSDPNRSG